MGIGVSEAARDLAYEERASIFQVRGLRASKPSGDVTDLMRKHPSISIAPPALSDHLDPYAVVTP